MVASANGTGGHVEEPWFYWTDFLYPSAYQSFCDGRLRSNDSVIILLKLSELSCIILSTASPTTFPFLTPPPSSSSVSSLIRQSFFFHPVRYLRQSYCSCTYPSGCSVLSVGYWRHFELDARFQA